MPSSWFRFSILHPIHLHVEIHPRYRHGSTFGQPHPIQTASSEPRRGVDMFARPIWHVPLLLRSWEGPTPPRGVSRRTGTVGIHDSCSPIRPQMYDVTINIQPGRPCLRQLVSSLLLRYSILRAYQGISDVFVRVKSDPAPIYRIDYSSNLTSAHCVVLGTVIGRRPSSATARGFYPNLPCPSNRH